MAKNSKEKQESVTALFWTDDVYSTWLHKGPSTLVSFYSCFFSVAESVQARACFLMNIFLIFNYGHLLQSDIVFSIWDLLN